MNEKLIERNLYPTSQMIELGSKIIERVSGSDTYKNENPSDLRHFQHGLSAKILTNVSKGAM